MIFRQCSGHATKPVFLECKAGSQHPGNQSSGKKGFVKIPASESRESRLASRPKGVPTAANFSLAQVELKPLQAEQVLVHDQHAPLAA